MQKPRKKSESNFLFSLNVFFESLFIEFVIVLLVLCSGFLAKKQVGSWLLDQGSNMCPLHWKAESGLDHQGSSVVSF